MARRKSGNDIPEEKYLEAINWLDDGGTKKGACEILGVSNNKIMERLIDEFLDRKRISKELRAKKRTQAVDKAELVQIITDYLNGMSIAELAESYYRSTNIIKYHLEKHGALLRQSEKIDMLAPPPLPDECISDSFEVGQYVWSAKYGCIAQIKGFYKDAIRIQVLGNGRQESSYQPPWELGSLRHLEKLGVDPKKFADYMDGEDTKYLLNKTMLEANKNYRKQNAK